MKYPIIKEKKENDISSMLGKYSLIPDISECESSNDDTEEYKRKKLLKFLNLQIITFKNLPTLLFIVFIIIISMLVFENTSLRNLNLIILNKEKTNLKFIPDFINLQNNLFKV
jgi:hypothetical protein